LKPTCSAHAKDVARLNLGFSAEQLCDGFVPFNYGTKSFP
jgi:hypothetical protein